MKKTDLKEGATYLIKYNSNIGYYKLDSSITPTSSSFNRNYVHVSSAKFPLIGVFIGEHKSCHMYDTFYPVFKVDGYDNFNYVVVHHCRYVEDFNGETGSTQPRQIKIKEQESIIEAIENSIKAKESRISKLTLELKNERDKLFKAKAKLVESKEKLASLQRYESDEEELAAIIEAAIQNNIPLIDALKGKDIGVSVSAILKQAKNEADKSKKRELGEAPNKRIAGLDLDDLEVEVVK